MTRTNNPRDATFEWIAVLFLAIASFSFYVGYGWLRFPRIEADHGWFLQVAQRVAHGEILYRDVLWMYGPLPVMLMSRLMQFGRADFAFYSMMNVSAATSATLVLYWLHRSIMNWGRAIVATLFIALGCSLYLLFLNAYTPGITLGLLGVLLLWAGVLKSAERNNRFLIIGLIILGIVISGLSKIEYAFASVGLGFISLVGAWRLRLVDSDQPHQFRNILVGVVIGIGIVLAAYIQIANVAGWANVWSGLMGYERGQLAANELIAYNGLDTWIKLLLALLILVVLSLIGAASSSFRRRWWILLTVIGLSGFGFFLFSAWNSGWLVRMAQGYPITWADFLFSARAKNLGAWVLDASRQIYLTFSFGIFLLCARLFVRWARRFYFRSTVTRVQWFCLVTLAFMQLIQLRYMLYGTLLPGLGLVLLLSVLSSEFPSWSWQHQSILFSGILCALFLIGIFNQRLDFLANSRATLPTAYGSIDVLPATRDFLGEVVQYIDGNSQPQDSIVVMGPLAGIYYLSQRRNPLRQDYQDPGLGENETEAQDYLQRLEADAPTLVLIPQGEWSMGILNFRKNVAPVRWKNVRAFRDKAPQVEAYLLEHYRFDRFLGGVSHFELAAFKRIVSTSNQ